MCETTEEKDIVQKSEPSIEAADIADEPASAAPGAVIREKPIKSHMAAAVITTVFLGNWALGIPAIVFARECELAAKNGQMEIARRFSGRALTFLCIGSALSVATASFLLLLMMILGEAMGGLM